MTNLNRRLFLRKAAGAAAFFLAPAARGFASVPPSEATWRRFAFQLAGALVRPGSPRYGEVYPPLLVDGMGLAGGGKTRQPDNP